MCPTSRSTENNYNVYLTLRIYSEPDSNPLSPCLMNFKAMMFHNPKQWSQGDHHPCPGDQPAGPEAGARGSWGSAATGSRLQPEQVLGQRRPKGWGGGGRGSPTSGRRFYDQKDLQLGSPAAQTRTPGLGNKISGGIQ